MPRTKRPTAKKENTTDDETLKKLDRLVADHKKKLEMKLQRKCRDIELAFKILIDSLSPDVLNKTVGELRQETQLMQARPASHDDGYLTEGSSQRSGSRGRSNMGPPSTASRSTRRSRSAAASARKPSARSKPRRSQSVYRTPAYNKNCPNLYPDITPKVAPHTPLTLLRQPRQGEMVVSMSGSPVMVPSYNNMAPTEKANCNIMLQDGTMLSLQPKQLRTSKAFIPFSLMDAGVLSQLKTLKENLDKVVQMGERVLKD